MRRPSRDRWLVSYADFITLLFAFFVVMYSAAQLDKRRAAELATAIQTAFLQGGSLPPNPAGAAGASSVASSDATLGYPDGGEDLTSVATRVEHTLAPEIASGDVAVRSSSEGLIVSLREIGFFDSGSDKIKPGAAAAFARLAEVLQPTTNHIRIEGHTDNVPIHNARFFSNWDLSSARATETVRLLIHDGLGPERLAAAGYSEYHAVASNNTPDGRALNRRVDVVIIRHTAP